MFIKQGTKTIPILMYHGISQFANRRYRNLGLSPILFRAQIDYLHRNAYTPLNVTQLISILTDKSPLPERPVVLTFDDGFADFYYNALPALSNYKFTATLYIATSFVEKTSLWLRWEKERPILTWNQIVEISNSGIECAAHTHSHLKLDTLPLMRVRKEILLSKDLLEQHLDQQVTSFAYPYGYYTADIRQLVKEAGFTSACIATPAMYLDTADYFTLGRLAVTPYMNMDAFHNLLTQKDYSQLKKVYTQALSPVKHTFHRCTTSMLRSFRTAKHMIWQDQL